MNAQQATEPSQEYSPTSPDETKDPEEHKNAAGETTDSQTQNQHDQDGEEHSPATAPSQEDIKIVIFRTANRSTIGVHRTDTDPHLEVYHHGDLDLLIETASATIRSALQKWESQPRNPKHSPPAKTRQQKNQRNASKTSTPPTEPNQTDTNEENNQQQTLVDNQQHQTESKDKNKQPEAPANDQPAQGAFSLF